jgi:hypothetical protein
MTTTATKTRSIWHGDTKQGARRTTHCKAYILSADLDLGVGESGGGLGLAVERGQRKFLERERLKCSKASSKSYLVPT